MADWLEEQGIPEIEIPMLEWHEQYAKLSDVQDLGIIVQQRPISLCIAVQSCIRQWLWLKKKERTGKRCYVIVVDPKLDGDAIYKTLHAIECIKGVEDIYPVEVE